MIGTVFIHAVTNLQSTYADHTMLTLKYCKLLVLGETTGVSVDRIGPEEEAPDEPEGTMLLMIWLGNLQYVQSCDIYLRITSAGRTMSLSKDTKKPGLAKAVLSYSYMRSSVYRCITQCLMSDTPLVTEAEWRLGLKECGQEIHEIRKPTTEGVKKCWSPATNQPP